MANSEHIAKLKDGVKSWNEWRQTQDIVVPDLSCANLRDHPDLRHLLRNQTPTSTNKLLCLPEIDLSRAKLEHSNLYMSNLSNANLSNANLAYTNLTHSTLQNADLEGAKFQETDLSGTTLIGANLTGTTLLNAVLYSSPPPSSPPVKQSTRFEDVKLPPVQDISKLLEAFQLLRCHYKQFPSEQTTLFFRGESKDCWKLSPSVMRNGAPVQEGEMLLDLLSRRPEDFQAMNTALSQWVLAQHHGLKTRLVDVTRNPLVGLFNACDSKSPEHKSINGRMHVFAVPRVYQVSTDEFRSIKSFNSDTVSVIANFAKLSIAEQQVILGNGGVSRKPYDLRPITYDRAMRRLYHFIRQEKPNFGERIDIRDLFSVFVIEPQETFRRIIAQSGAFLISGFHRRFEETELRKWRNGIPHYHHYMLTIPSCKKDQLLEQLQMLNITREVLYPDLEEATNAINQQYITC